MISTYGRWRPRGMAADAATQANAYAAYIDKASADVGAWPKNARSRLVASWGLARLAKASPDQGREAGSA